MMMTTTCQHQTKEGSPSHPTHHGCRALVVAIDFRLTFFARGLGCDVRPNAKWGNRLFQDRAIKDRFQNHFFASQHLEDNILIVSVIQWKV